MRAFKRQRRRRRIIFYSDFKACWESLYPPLMMVLRPQRSADENYKRAKSFHLLYYSYYYYAPLRRDHDEDVVVDVLYQFINTRIIIIVYTQIVCAYYIITLVYFRVVILCLDVLILADFSRVQCTRLCDFPIFQLRRMIHYSGVMKRLFQRPWLLKNLLGGEGVECICTPYF